MDTMMDRVLKAAQLDVDFFNEVEADQSLNQEALMVVILVSVISGVGSFVGAVMGGSFGTAVLALIVTVLMGVINYYIWSYVAHYVGSALFQATSDPGELLRVLGYASGPRVLGVLGFIPCLGVILSLAGAVWALVAGFIGVREALDLDTGKTLITVVIGWLIIMVLNMIIAAVLGVGGLGLGAAASAFGR